jgi:hypothetical protein
MCRSLHWSLSIKVAYLFLRVTTAQNMVYNNDAKRINKAAIQSLDHDLRYAEGYIRQWNIPSLQSALQELRQVKRKTGPLLSSVTSDDRSASRC